jgi:hypothetical protein
MKAEDGSNKLYTPVRLSVMAASREFDLSRNAIKARLQSTQPGEDGCYSILQVANAIYNDSKALKDQTEIERCRWYKLRNEAIEGRMLDRAALEEGLSASYSAIRLIIEGTHLSRRDKDDIYKQLAHCPVVVQQIADKQSRDIKRRDEDPSDE